MKIKMWKKLLAVGLIGGSFLFQTPTCTDTAQVVTATSSVLTMGGVLYIVDRLIND